MSLAWEHLLPRSMFHVLRIYSELYPIGRSHGWYISSYLAHCLL